VIHYDFPNTDVPATTELYVAAGLDVLLQPRITLYRDVDESDGVYVAFTMQHGIPLRQNAELNLIGGIGVGSKANNSYNYGSVENSAITDGFIRAELPVTLREHVTLTPSVTASALLDGAVRAAMPHDDNVFYGATLSFEF